MTMVLVSERPENDHDKQNGRLLGFRPQAYFRRDDDHRPFSMVEFVDAVQVLLLIAPEHIERIARFTRHLADDMLRRPPRRD